MLELPPDHRALLATVRRFCRERLEPHVSAFEAGDEPLEPFFRELSEALGLREVASALVDGTPSPFEALPPLLLTSFVMHELSRCCPGVALSFGATKNGALGAEAVVLFKPTKEQRERLAYLHKRGGHLVSKMRFVSAQLEAYVKDGHWLQNAARANTMARASTRGGRRFRARCWSIRSRPTRSSCACPSRSSKPCRPTRPKPPR